MPIKKTIRRCLIDIFLYKTRYFTILICFLFTLLFFTHIGEIFHNNHNDDINEYVYYGDPIDVVYTWVNGSDPLFVKSLKEHLNENEHNDNDYSETRYDDKYELKYSLRSLEKYASWIRHVYIVTNGQIPYWLNLDYEHVTLITHDEIYVDKNDLPTFSSPSIESHIHRIPGLSKRFIYLNDDMFLNAPIYPEDFYSPNLGFLIYLSWPIPNCASDCPWSYVGDEQCDRSCFNKECQFDGGDCTDTHKKQRKSKIDEYEESNEALNNEEEEEYYELPKIETIPMDPVIKPNISYQTPVFLNRFINTVGTKPITNNTNKQLSVVKPFNISEIVSKHNKRVLEDNHLRRKKNRSLRKHKKLGKNTTYQISNGPMRKPPVDGFAMSLQHSNRVFNTAYKYIARKVPAHAPIMIDRDVMEELQIKFWKEFRKTSKNKLRSSDDIQFSFSYYYYLISEMKNQTVGEIFDIFDTDQSGTWSDREIRTILTRLNNLPLTYSMVDLFDQIVINCSRNIEVPEVSVPPYERYIDSKLPTISKELIEKCPQMVETLEDHFGTVDKYKYKIVKNSHGKYVVFTMLTSNITNVVGHLDEIRKSSRKFICLNDDIDPEKVHENEIVRDILLDFYMSLFPKPSRYELPEEFRNRFTYINELNNWKYYHAKTKIFIFICVIFLFIFSFNSIFKRRVTRHVKKYIYF